MRMRGALSRSTCWMLRGLARVVQQGHREGGGAQQAAELDAQLGATLLEVLDLEGELVVVEHPVAIQEDTHLVGVALDLQEQGGPRPTSGLLGPVAEHQHVVVIAAGCLPVRLAIAVVIVPVGHAEELRVLPGGQGDLPSPFFGVFLVSTSGEGRQQEQPGLELHKSSRTRGGRRELSDRGPWRQQGTVCRRIVRAAGARWV